MFNFFEFLMFVIFMYVFLYFAFCIVLGLTGRFFFFFFFFSFFLQWRRGHVCIFSFILTETRNIILTLYSQCPLDEGPAYFWCILLLVCLLLFAFYFIIHIYSFEIEELSYTRRFSSALTLTFATTLPLVSEAHLELFCLWNLRDTVCLSVCQNFASHCI